MKKLEQLKHESRNAHVFMKPNLKEDSSTRWSNKKVYESLTIFDGTSLEKISYKEDLKCELIDNKLVMFGMTYAEGKTPRPTLSVIINTNNTSVLTVTVNIYTNICKTVFVNIEKPVGTTMARQEIKDYILSLYPGFDRVRATGTPESYTFVEEDGVLPGTIKID